MGFESAGSTGMLDRRQLFRRTVQYHVNRQIIARWAAARSEPSALAFYSAIRNGGFDLDTWIDVLPRQSLIYIAVPKAASTTIRSILSEIANSSKPPDQGVIYKRRCSGLLSPSMAGLDRFYRLATSADTLCFTFVRNPYARLVSAWSDKFSGKPLRRGDPYIDLYLNHAASCGHSPPSIEPLSFPAFVQFVHETMPDLLDPHWDHQVRRTSLPGIELGLIGRVENFGKDFGNVLEHARQPLIKLRRLNKSGASAWASHYTDELAKTVYRLYEQDFDTFNYSGRIPAE